MAEAKYYLIQGLVNMCQSALQVRRQRQGGLMRAGLAPSFRDVGCSSWKTTWQYEMSPNLVRHTMLPRPSKLAK